MYELNLAQIEAVTAGSEEKWWYKPPKGDDFLRIELFAKTLTTEQVNEFYVAYQRKAFSTVNNRFYYFLCEVAKIYEARQTMISDSD